KHGASLCQMSGSGPTVFGLFESRECAENCAAELKTICPEVFVTVPVRHGARVVDMK
ncbi:MAG: 4-(cytidine 5'-diphospho)-2-C-methyl-D-erythritol kinase, partial [Acutalibacteraceae bacterium]